VSAIITGVLLFNKKYKKIFTQGKVVRNTSLIRTQLKYAFRVFLSANARIILIQIDQQLIINILGPAAAGYFTNYISMIMAYTIITVPVLSLTFPIISEIIAKKEHSKLELLQNTLYKYFSVFALSI
jgi:O-antigen/teichoic acid export membrane protein